MRKTMLSLAALLGLLVWPSLLPRTIAAQPPSAVTPVIHHELQARIDPDTGILSVVDQMRFPDGKSEWPLILHTGLNPKVEAGEASLSEAANLGHLTGYRLRLGASNSVTIAYEGPIRHDLERIDESLGRARQWSRGIIDPNGVFLNGNSGWYPRVPDTFQSFTLNAQLPQGWSGISQGAGASDASTGRAHWSETQPQDDIHLVAAPLQGYRKKADGFEAQVYLRQPDPELAARYLDATLEYLAFYSDLIGPYPYAKFALVENFWESGYGMPSFTLLGPSVIRLPFILDTSYPHEILHNWWGNGVFVDHDSGNWSEGLTHYLADYWLMERAGRGVEGRRDMLKRFADHVRGDKDFPLTDFTQRHGADSQAIGYGKAAMVFHMLRRDLGEAAFIAGLRRFHADNRFRLASYGDLQRAFESTSGRDLSDFFSTWTKRTGAPRLALEGVELTRSGDRFVIEGLIRQTQPDPPFPLRIPLVTDTEAGEPSITLIESRDRETRFAISLQSAPTRLRLDPEFDLFRELADGETPVTLGNLFGAERGLLLIPAEAPEALKQGYRHLAETWRAGHPGWRIREDTELRRLPDDQPVWLLGWENRHLDTLEQALAGFGLEAKTDRPRLADSELDPDTESMALTAWTGSQPVAWIATRQASALPALTRKLPHYGKYSYLVFSGPASANRLKGQWPSGDSTLTVSFLPAPE